METKIPEQITEMTKNMVDSLMQLQSINDQTMQKLAKQQLDATSAMIEAGTKQLKMISEVRDVKDAIAKQAELATEIGKQMMTHAQGTVDVLMKSRDEINGLMQKNIKTLMGNKV